MTRNMVVAAMLALGAAPALAHNPPFVYRPKAAEQTTTTTPNKTETQGSKSQDDTKKAESTGCHCPCSRK